MSIANEYTDTFYFTHFQLEDPVNATYIITFWNQWPCSNDNSVIEFPPKNTKSIRKLLELLSTYPNTMKVWIYKLS